MRISDWSSDVCSSDLSEHVHADDTGRKDMTLETTRRRFLVGSGLVAAAAVSLPAFAQDRPKLRFSAVFSEQDIRAEMMQMFDEAIKEDFDFEGYSGGTIFKQGTALVAIQRGNLEMGNIAPT